MLFGTRKVSDLSLASTSSTAENQRLKVSALTCGFNAGENRSSRRTRCRGDPSCDGQRKCREKPLKTPKCEGKILWARCNTRRSAARSTSELSLFSGEVKASFILTARSFSEMFTSYSHPLPFCAASGLEIRNHRENRQEKN